jgi:hypothetical protein
MTYSQFKDFLLNGGIVHDYLGWYSLTHYMYLEDGIVEKEQDGWSEEHFIKMYHEVDASSRFDYSQVTLNHIKDYINEV